MKFKELGKKHYNLLISLFSFDKEIAFFLSEVENYTKKLIFFFKKGFIIFFLLFFSRVNIYNIFLSSFPISFSFFVIRGQLSFIYLFISFLFSAFCVFSVSSIEQTKHNAKLSPIILYI